ncbi:thiamine biosynthesis oxidoreductase ThiO, partial [Gordonia hirsuta DSM 44140 = NBRC 16056]
LRRLGDPAVTVAHDTLLVAGSAADRADLDETMACAQAIGADTGALAQTAAQLRAAEPALARTPAGGYLLPGEGAVDNRRLLEALRAALTAAGGELVRQTVTDPAELPGDQILLAAGLDSAALVPGGLPGLRGEKGEVIRLRRTGWSVPPPRRVIRGRWHGRNVYLVPRIDGLVLGATQYEAHDREDRLPQAGGVLDLLTDACELFPGLRTYEISEVAAGIRPMSPDGLPMVRRLDGRTVLAVGHGRNGIALAPGTAAQVMTLLDQNTTECDRRERKSR